VSIIDNVKSEIMLLNEKFMLEADDKYNMWEEHVKYVVQEALALAEKYNADLEIVELATILHDVAMIAKVGTRQDHHKTGAEMAQAILAKYGYPQSRIDRVKSCVLNHRSSKGLTGNEELCVADADILAHFDNVPMLLNLFFKKLYTDNMTLPELRSRMKEFFDHDYNDLSERTKQEYRDRYKLLCRIVLGE